MRTLSTLIAAACMIAALQAPARAQRSERERQAREEREKARQEREESRNHLEREREELRKQLERERGAARDTFHEIRIRNSGKKSKDILILKYGKDDHDLISVIDNGKLIPKEDFPKYGVRLREALGAREIDELRPHLQELQEIIESRRRTNEEKIEALRQVIEELKDRESETAAFARDLYIARLSALDAKRFAFDPPIVLGLDGKDRMTIRIREDGCYMNGKKLPADVCERLLEIRRSSGASRARGHESEGIEAKDR